MRKAFLAALAALFWAATAFAQSDVTPGERAAIRATIESQIAAFRRHDGPAAFGFASDGIKSMFQTPENFMTMVREGYGAIYAPRGYDFAGAKRENGHVMQEVDVDGLDGTAYTAIYDMEPQPGGGFKIAGVYLVRRQRPGV